jgi:FkbM family methyltransferase
MSLISGFARGVAFPLLELIAGRKNAVRLGRALSMAARRDIANDMASNGELLVQQVVLRDAQGPLCIFDVGANAGHWSSSLLAAAAGRDIEIHVFEPASATFAILKNNLAAAGQRIHFVQQALSSAPGSAQLHIVGDGLGVNSLHHRADASGAETITLNTVDDYCAAAGITRIDLIKIDAEGHDLSVMEGAKRMLASKSIAAMQFEYNQRWIDSRHFLKDAFELLQPLGYEIGKATPKGIEFYPAYHFELESYREGNYLACLPALKDVFPQLKWWNLE